MRHIKTRRQFKSILILLFTICLTLFFENRIEAFVPHLKSFAEAKIEETLDGKFKLSIGSIDGGILHPLTFNDIRLKNKKEARLFPSLAISSIKTNYRIWDVFFKRNANSAISNLLLADSCIDANFATRNRELTGFLRIERGPDGSEIKGYVYIFDKNRVDFNGIIKQDSFDVEIKLRPGTLRAKGTVTENGDLLTNLKINHISWGGFDIVCDAVLKNKVMNIPDNPRMSYLEGDLETKNLILNYKPFLDLKTSYKISGGVLNISELSLGEGFKGYGSVTLKRPYNIDIDLVANNVSISWLLLNLGSKDTTPLMSGTMNGKFDFNGSLTNLKSSAHIEIRKGTISGMEFDYLSAILKGEGPILRIDDSRITRESGYFVLIGEMDLRRLGKNTFFDDIKMGSDDKAITWDGWDVAKREGVQEVRMKKKLSDDVNLDFKKFITDEKIDESIGQTDEVQLEYKLHPNDSLKMMVGQDKDFLGFEHKDRF